jgi:hypothetical protein
MQIIYNRNQVWGLGYIFASIQYDERWFVKFEFVPTEGEGIVAYNLQRLMICIKNRLVCKSNPKSKDHLIYYVVDSDQLIGYIYVRAARINQDVNLQFEFIPARTTVGFDNLINPDLSSLLTQLPDNLEFLTVVD